MPIDNDHLSTILRDLYAAAAMSDRWEPFLRSIKDAIGGTASSILVRDEQERFVGQHAVSIGVEEKYQRAYREYYSGVNIVYSAALERDPHNYIGTLQSVIDLDIYRKSEIYNDYARPQNLFYQCSALLSRRASYVAAISFMRPESDGPYTDEHIQILQLLAPHMRQAFELHGQLRRYEVSEAGLATALDQSETAMFLLDGYGCLLRANAAGYALLAEDTCLILKDNSLRPTLQVDCAEFERLIAVTCGTGSGRGVFPGGYMLLHRKVGRPLHCKVTPFCSDNNFFGTAPSAIVFIGNPEKAPVARSKALRSLYRLTPAESELADLLLAGETIASAAERRHISEASARTQLKSILHKTGTKRQSELIRLSLNIPV